VIILGDDLARAPSKATPDATTEQRAPADTAARFLTVRGIPIRYVSAGSGKPLLLLHGWGTSLDAFAEMTRDLARPAGTGGSRRSFQVTAFDFPGHGESGLPPGTWTVDDFMDLTLDLMAELGLQRPSIIGHSFGGRVAIKLAAANPDRIERLVLVDAAGVLPRRTTQRVLRRAASRFANAVGRHFGRPGQALRRRIVARIASPDYLNAGPLRDTFLAVIKEDLRPALAHIGCPTLLVWGDGDEDTPLADARIMEKLIPGARLLVLKNAGHFSYLDQYGRFRLAIIPFLND
jgi:pimeloyl-ACP methyl ester carboxylesterase